MLPGLIYGFLLGVSVDYPETMHRVHPNECRCAQKHALEWRMRGGEISVFEIVRCAETGDIFHKRFPFCTNVVCFAALFQIFFKKCVACVVFQKNSGK